MFSFYFMFTNCHHFLYKSLKRVNKVKLTAGFLFLGSIWLHFGDNYLMHFIFPGYTPCFLIFLFYPCSIKQFLFPNPPWPPLPNLHPARPHSDQRLTFTSQHDDSPNFHHWCDHTTNMLQIVQYVIYFLYCRLFNCHVKVNLHYGLSHP